MAPLDDRRTRPAVSAIARFVLAHSNVALPLSQVPPLAWRRPGWCAGRRRRRPGTPWCRTSWRSRRAGVAVLREGVRPRRHGLGPQGVDPGTAAGVAPARRHLAGHDTAQVALDGHVVDDPAVAGAVAGQLDPPPVVGDRAVVGAQPEHVAGRAGRLVDQRSERHRAGDVGGDPCPAGRRRRRAGHRRSGPDVVAVRRRRRPRLQRGVAGRVPHIAVRLVEITPTVASPSWPTRRTRTRRRRSTPSRASCRRSRR